jgi:hypothetical protein
VVHHKAPVVGLHVWGQAMRAWLISPETLVVHLLSQWALAIWALSHLLRTGRTRLRGRHPRWLLRGLAECVHQQIVCKHTTQLTQAPPPKHTCVERGAQTAYEHVQQHQIRQQTVRQAKRATSYAPPLSPWMTWCLGGHWQLDADAKLVNFFVCVCLCPFLCPFLCLFVSPRGVSSCV